ncbi:Fic family protein [Streptomyces mangrovisoli]|uniref:Fido domain-containing protein n=1 Tax=Streptomyces mangrovisoli TaxID=1428628 RepID=A0A1J4P2T6_9ACTN|nr:Fic family protein [Streptomyces mangrovisoli]OIJ68522.1 hypothetical protein WN71_006900 [Streptomyces mangrovisoli]
MTADALAAWCRVREQVDWTTAAAPAPPRRRPAGPAARHEPPPHQPDRDGLAAAHAPSPRPADGLAAWCDGPVRRRDPVRADRLLGALALSRADAARGAPLTVPLLAGWQRQVLGVPVARLRRTDAFAKGGRERYGLTPSTWRDFTRCLRQSGDLALPPPTRAARAYLDVAFFHPFPDGNARLALLVLGYVLESAGVRLDEVGPLAVARHADDPAGAADLAALVAVLARAAHRRSGTSGRPADTRGPGWAAKGCPDGSGATEGDTSGAQRGSSAGGLERG